jgi:hypothetical protein
MDSEDLPQDELLQEDLLRADLLMRLNILERYIGPDIYAAMPNRHDASVEDLRYIYDMGRLMIKNREEVNEARDAMRMIYFILESPLTKLGYLCGPELITQKLKDLDDAKSLTALNAIFTKFIASIEEITLRLPVESTDDSERLDQILNICQLDINASEMLERITRHFINVEPDEAQFMSRMMQLMIHENLLNRIL